jgi:hypothetical protein
VQVGRLIPLAAVLLAASLVASCRSAPLAPVRAPEPAALAGSVGSDPGLGYHVGSSGVRMPVIRDMRGDVRGDTLVLRARFEPFAARLRRPYDPSHAGGWILQLFMNTDQAPSGYPWMGIDYLVRGGEVRPDGGLVVRRVELDDSFPGGWGPESGSARLSQAPEDFTLAVPLRAIGDDDGALDFVLETYAVVDCPECEGGVTAEWAGDFFGTTTGRHLTIADLAAPSVAWLSRDDAVRSGRFGALLAATAHHDDTAR